ncbi:MAG: SHOCT-like domain-containing protein [Bacillota bacterium]
MSEERLQILKMIESGKISAEEGAKLLSAVETTQAAEATGKPAHFLRVKVYEIKSGRATVNVNLPLSLLDVALKFVPKDAEFMKGMKGVNLDELVAAIKSGVQGKVVDIVDEEEGHHVEVYVD